MIDAFGSTELGFHVHSWLTTSRRRGGTAGPRCQRRESLDINTASSALGTSTPRTSLPIRRAPIGCVEVAMLHSLRECDVPHLATTASPISCLTSSWLVHLAPLPPPLWTPPAPECRFPGVPSSASATRASHPASLPLSTTARPGQLSPLRVPDPRHAARRPRPTPAWPTSRAISRYHPTSCSSRLTLWLASSRQPQRSQLTNTLGGFEWSPFNFNDLERP